MMLQNDVFLAFKELGWKIGRDEAGDRYAIYPIGEIEVQVIMRLEPRKVGKRLLLMKSLGLPVLNAIVGKIFGRKSEHVPIIVGKDDNEQSEFKFEDIRLFSERLIEGAQQQDVDAALKKLRELPTDAKGALPLRHLGALALAGDLDQLESYQEAFEHGDRLGFVPYISKEMIDRAIHIVKENRL